MDIAHVGVSASKETDPLVQKDNKANIAPNTTASNHFEAGKVGVGGDASAGANDKGLYAKASGHGEATAFKDELQVKNETKLLDGKKPLNTVNTVKGTVTGGGEVHANAQGHLDKNGNAGAGVDVGGSGGITGNITGSTELNTVGDDGKPENLASASADLHGHLGPAGGIKAGFEFKDGKLSTEFGVDASPIVGGGFNVKLGANFGNIAKEGQKIAEELGKGAGDAGYQAQQQIGQTLSGIQRFLGGVHLFG